MKKISKRRGYGFIYVIVFENGNVKVGQTTNPEIRHKQHERTLGRDSKIIDTWTSSTHYNYFENERLLIEKLGNNGSEIGKASFNEVVEFGKSLQFLVETDHERISRSDLDLKRSSQLIDAAKNMASSLGLCIPIGKSMFLSLCGHKFKIDHSTMIGSLTDIWNIGNSFRESRGLKSIDLSNFLRSPETFEFVTALENDLCVDSVEQSGIKQDGRISTAIESELISSTRGKQGETKAHLLIMLEAARVIDSAFRLELYKAGCHGELIEFS